MNRYAAEAKMSPEVKKVLADPQKATDLLRRLLYEKEKDKPGVVRVHGLALRSWR